jgi:hypothetical protein
MWFDYYPPKEYFAKVFAKLGTMDPKPYVEFYGGEPTVRADLVELVAMAREHGLKIRVLTNGVKLADEEYTRKLCEAKIPVRIAFDGRDRSIYERLRGDGSCYEKKLKAFEHLKKYGRRKHSILCCFAKGLNDHLMADLIEFCHGYHDVLNQIGLVPYREDWEGGPEGGIATTMEDAEEAIRKALPEDDVQFIPVGLAFRFAMARSFFTSQKRSELFMLGGAHPNCESVTFLVSDGQRYRGINRFLKIPLAELAQVGIRKVDALNVKLAKLDPKRFVDRWHGRMLVASMFLPMIPRAVNYRAIFKGNLLWGMMKVGWRWLVRGERFPVALRNVTGLPGFLRVVVIPFEEYRAIDGRRLSACKGGFAYEDVADGQIKFIPSCTWFVHRNGILKTITEKYGIAGRKPATAEPAESAAPATRVAETA